MQLKLVIDGSDQRIRITANPKRKSDKKLLEYILEWDIAKIKSHKDTYSKEIDYIDLHLCSEEVKDEDGNIGYKEILLPISNN